MSKTKCNLSAQERVELLAQLRDTRALMLRDAESFHEASTTLEHIGQVIGRSIKNGLSRYEEEIVCLAMEAGNSDFDEAGFRRLFNVVREARNTTVHDGAYARHLSSRLIELYLILEEAIMSKMQFRTSKLLFRARFDQKNWPKLMIDDGAWCDG